MNIIIIGAGDIGFNLAKMLSFEKHDITLIALDTKKYSRALNVLDANVIFGSGTSFALLEQAGIRDADLVVSVTNIDEVNMLAAIIAKEYGVPKTVARVKNMEFLQSDSPISQKRMNIDMLIHPESIAAQNTVSLLKQAAATDFIEFADGKIILMGIHLDESLKIFNIPLSEIVQQNLGFTFRIIAIHRKEKTTIPGGDDVLLPNDRIFVIVAKENEQDIVRLTGKENTKIEDVMILGGGYIGYSIARELEQSYNVKIIESNIRRSYNLAEKLKKSLVLKGDGLDLSLLASEGINEMDAFIAVTGDDETNIVSCLMAKHLNVSKIISLINKTEYWPIIPTIGIDAYVSKQLLAVNRILKFIRRGLIVNVASIPGIAAEVIELIPHENSKITKQPLYEITFPHDAIIGAVMRKNQVFIPDGNTHIQVGDKVVVFALPSDIYEVEKIFK
ncbi:Trk system potassium transporter TrkA [bacterium]|nr:Trk system potassium transporter TrkA [bacterium]